MQSSFEPQYYLQSSPKTVKFNQMLQDMQITPNQQVMQFESHLSPEVSKQLQHLMA